MERELLVRWMVNGPGGYVEHRYRIRLPSLTDILIALTVISLALELWYLWKA